MEVERNRRIDEGEKLHVEKEEDDTSEIIWNQIEQVLGKKFWDIDYEEKAYRYKFISDYEERSESGNKKTNKTQGNKKKPWWRFW